MSGSVRRAEHETRETIEAGGTPHTTTRTTFDLADDWGDYTGSDGHVFRPRRVWWTRWKNPNGSLSSHMNATGVRVKKNGELGRKTHFEYGTPVSTELFLAARERWGESL